MPHHHDTVSMTSGQGEPLCILLPLGLWLEMPDTWANLRGIMILLRSLRAPDGRPLVTYAQIAQALGSADRRNVHNCVPRFGTNYSTNWP